MQTLSLAGRHWSPGTSSTLVSHSATSTTPHTWHTVSWSHQSCILNKHKYTSHLLLGLRALDLCHLHALVLGDGATLLLVQAEAQLLVAGGALRLVRGPALLLVLHPAVLAVTTKVFMASWATIASTQASRGSAMASTKATSRYTVTQTMASKTIVARVSPMAS